MPSHPDIDMDAAANSRADVAHIPSAASDKPRSPWLRALRKVLLGIITQYIIIAATVGLSLAATLHYYVTPQIVAQYEAIARALKP
jgi:hypothetical protein